MNTEASRLLTVSDLYEFSIFAGLNLMVVEVAFVFKIFFMVLLSPAIILGILLFFSSVFTHRLEYIRVKGYLFVVFANFLIGCLSVFCPCKSSLTYPWFFLRTFLLFYQFFFGFIDIFGFRVAKLGLSCFMH